MADFYTGIELAVRTSGQQAVQSLANEVSDLKSKLALYQAQVATGAAVTTKEIAEFAALQAQIEKATAAHAAAQRVMAGLPARLNDTSYAARGAADAMLQLSRGLEDLSTGGFIGIVNNLPGIARGIGTAFGATAPQIAAAETAVSLFGTAAYVAYSNWGRFKALLDDGTGPRLLPDLQDLQKQLKELEKIEAPTLIQVADMERLEKAVALEERLVAARKAQSGQTDEDKKQAGIVNAGIVEATRGDLSKVDDLIKRSIPKTAEEAEVEKWLDYWQRTRRDETDTANQQVQDQKIKEFQAKLGTFRDNRNTAAANISSRAGIGDEAAIRELARILNGNRQFATDTGIDVGKLGKALSDALAVPSGYTKEGEKEAEKARKAAEDAAKKLVADTVRDVKRGFDDGAADAIQTAVAGGTSADEAKAAAKAAMLPGLQQRGVGAAILDKVAEQIADDAKNEALNRLNEGERSKLQVARDAAKAKGEREKTQRENEAQQEVNRHVAAAGGGFRDQVEAELYRAMSGGGDVAATRRAQFGHVAAGLADRGVPMEIITAVADAILKQAEDHATNAIQSGSQPRLIREARTAADAATRKQVNDLAPGYLPGIENFLAARADAIGRGVPVARDAADAQRLARSGEAYLPPAAESRRQLTAEVAAHLGQSRQDRGLAGPLVERGIESFRDKIGRGSGAGVDPLVSAAGIMRETQGHVLQLQQNAAQQAGILQGLQRGNDVLRRNNQQLHQATQRNRMRRPPLIGR